MVKLAKLVGIILLMGFFAMIFVSTNGYYEQKQSKQLSLTNDAIEQFEEDISEGKEIDISNYINTNKPDYNNRVSNLGKTVSNKINNVFSKGIKIIFKSIDKIIND